MPSLLNKGRPQSYHRQATTLAATPFIQGRHFRRGAFRSEIDSSPEPLSTTEWLLVLGAVKDHTSRGR